jgi:16S rRNA (cytidine1402-2'-O)-methyltransferase
VAGRLYVVATPIGNLEDLSPRAARVLREVAVVLAEDTRRSRILMDHVGARARLVSAHRHNEARRVAEALDRLAAGEDLALVTDAGTPVVSDPGSRLVEAAADAGFEVVPVPGPSAALAALSASGMAGDRFAFLGFPPRSGRARRDVLERCAQHPDTVILFEAPGRLVALLDDLAASCGSERGAAVGRELTKLHEEVVRGTLAEVAAYYRGNAPRGEVVVVLEGAPPTDRDGDLSERVAVPLADALLDRGVAPSAVAREVARRAGLSRNRAYEIAQARALERSKEG